MPEIFDVVDEADLVVGQALRSEVHERKLRHRAIHVLVTDRAGNCFLQLRSAKKDQFPNCWDSSCSGHVDAGEDYDACARRELEEELGLPRTESQPERLFKIEAREETGLEFVWVYKLSHDGPFRLHPDEISEGRFFAPKEIDDLLQTAPDRCANAFRYLWPLFRARSAQ